MDSKMKETDYGTKKFSLSHEEYLRVTDASSGNTYCGSDQDWYETEGQRLRGCGPSAAANILYYIYRKRNPNCCAKDKASLLIQMEEAWKYITPRTNGIISTSIFQKKVEAYAAAHDETFQYFTLDVPESREHRPKVIEVIHFLEKGLALDVPIAFLNLHNGKESRLERWHWVTVVSLEHGPNEEDAKAIICDEGLCKEIDISLWLNTSALGGGFIYFTEFEPIQNSERTM